MTEPVLLFGHQAGLTLLVMNRPAQGNALSDELVRTLDRAIESALADSATHTIALAARGRNFCTGFDLAQVELCSDADLLARFVAVEMLLDRIWRAPVRTVALVHGRAWGAGADLLSVCDRRVVAPDASFRFPGAGFGLVLGSRRLALRIGIDASRATIGEGLTLDAATALKLGLATETMEGPAVGEPERALDEALQPIAERFAPAPAIDRETLRQIRAATLRARESDAQAASDADLAHLVRSAARPGLRDRVIAYRDRVRGPRPTRD
jgi:enoyl-CoA hydratase/carnithine racemase